MYPDYAMPIAWADGDGLGVWPKFMQPKRIDDKGTKRRQLDTVNARSETVSGDIAPSDYDEWLHTKNIEAARTMLQLYPADGDGSDAKVTFMPYRL